MLKRKNSALQGLNVTFPKHTLVLCLALWALFGILLSPIVYIKLIYHWVYNYTNDLERALPLLNKADISKCKIAKGLMYIVLSLLFLPIGTILLYVIIFILIYKYMSN